MDAVIATCPHCQKNLKVSDRSKLGKRIKCPGCGEVILLQEKPQTAPVAASVATAAAQAATVTPMAPEGPIIIPDLPTETSPLGELRQRRKRRGKSGLWMGLIVLVLAGGAITFIVMNRKPETNRENDATADEEGGDASETDGNSNDDGISQDVALRLRELESESELVDAFDPTDGEPIELLMMPSGINGILHLRPREIWSNDLQIQTLRASLTEGVVVWLENFLKTHCRREPAQIEEALFGLFLGARGSEPTMAVVVQLAEDAKRSDLIEEFRGNNVLEREGLRINETDEYTYVVRGQRTIAICPRSMGEEIPEWVDVPNPNCSEGLLQLLANTDRSRLCTLMFDMEAVRRHEEDLFADDGRLAFQSVLDWFGDEVETLAWSLHVDEEHLHSQMYLRTSSITSPSRLRQTMRTRLEEAPQDLAALARLMDPQIVGFRQIIGRFPAMMEAYRRATVINVGDRYIRMTTILPAKAAPNLALGTMLTWRETTLTDFSAGAVVASNDDVPELTLEERLKLEVDAEFSGDPLEAAFSYIGRSIDAPTYLDGDGLETGGGYTRNMRQNFNLGKVPAEVALSKICSQYPGMVISIDHEANQIRLTTETAANAQGREIYPLPPAPE